MKKIIVIVIVILMVFLAGCGISSVQQQRIENVNASNTGNIYQVTNFVERQNINNRQKLFDNPALVSWIYCLAENGQVIFYGPVLGKVTSSSKRLEPIQTCGDSNCLQTYNGTSTNELMQQDGTFGQSDLYVYWFDPDGNYYQWGGNYFLTSLPIKINESVLDIRNVTK